jgi:hypothetical protein
MQPKPTAKFLLLAHLWASIAGATPPFGTWKLNLSKPTFKRGAAHFQSFTLTFAPADNGAYRATANRESSNGAPIKTTYLLKEDGKDHPVTNALFDSIAALPQNA